MGGWSWNASEDGGAQALSDLEWDNQNQQPSQGRQCDVATKARALGSLLMSCVTLGELLMSLSLTFLPL